MVQRPESFVVRVTKNMFGDIRSDLGARRIGGRGMAPSADLGATYGGLQPSRGTVPAIAGKGSAHPIAAILSVAMLPVWLDHPASLRGALDYPRSRGCPRQP